MKIYTRTGDKGETSLVNGTRVLKSHRRVIAYGTVDELNSVLGIAIKSLPKKNPFDRKLVSIQHDLFALGAYLADPKAKDSTLFRKRTDEFEKYIDKLSEDLPVLKYFILPGRGMGGSMLHFARTVCRRAEREIIRLNQEERIDPAVLKFINRLSDLLFTMARFSNMIDKEEEIKWKKS